MIVELTFGRCQNSKTVRCFLPGLSYLKGNAWVPAMWYGSTKNFEMFFPIPYQKLSTGIWLLQPVQFYARKTAYGPKKTLFLRCLREISPKLPLEWNSPKLWKLWATFFLLGIQKNINQKFSVEAVELLRSTTQGSFFWDKIPERLNVTFIDISQRPKKLCSHHTNSRTNEKRCSLHRVKEVSIHEGRHYRRLFQVVGLLLTEFK